MCFQLARLMSSNAPWEGVYPLTLSVMDLLTAQTFPMKCRVVVSKEQVSYQMRMWLLFRKNDCTPPIHIHNQIHSYSCNIFFSYFSCNSAACSHSKFRCANTMCISKWLLCDGSNDCGDNSDETDICGKSQIKLHHPVYCYKRLIRQQECLLRIFFHKTF